MSSRFPRRLRTIWISDVHLGIRDSKAGMLLDFLRCHEAERLYLVGDVIDGWALRRSWWWAPTHDAVIREILRKAAEGTNVIYVPGNHDEFARDYAGQRFAGVQVALDAMHTTADGRRLWVVHGDEFDLIIRNHAWLVRLGDVAYFFLLKANRVWNWVRRRFGLPYWSLAAYAKGQAKKAMEAMCDFTATITRAARDRGADGVVCGHIHHAEMRTVDGALYANDGDWVDSCTALVEHADGRLEILRWDRAEPSEPARIEERRPAPRPDRVRRPRTVPSTT